jgi:hypothetical protein
VSGPDQDAAHVIVSDYRLEQEEEVIWLSFCLFDPTLPEGLTRVTIPLVTFTISL